MAYEILEVWYQDTRNNPTDQLAKAQAALSDQVRQAAIRGLYPTGGVTAAVLPRPSGMEVHLMQAVQGDDQPVSVSFPESASVAKSIKVEPVKDVPPAAPFVPSPTKTREVNIGGATIKTEAFQKIPTPADLAKNAATAIKSKPSTK